MTYVLFVILVGFNGTPAITTAEFNTKQTCEAAATKANDSWNLKSAAYCVQK